MVFAAVFAGGIGSRMGNSDTPKQYLELGTKPVIIHTVEKFFINDRIDEILVLCPKAWVAHTKDLVEKYLPAVVEGTMFLGEESFAHEEAIKIARSRVEAIPYQNVAHAFIYGVARGIPAYRTAFPAYLHIKSIPEHGEDHRDGQEGSRR